MESKCLWCQAPATTEVRWTNFSGLQRDTLMCTAHAKEHVAKYYSRVQYAVAINPTTKKQREHKLAWKGTLS